MHRFIGRMLVLLATFSLLFPAPALAKETKTTYYPPGHAPESYYQSVYGGPLVPQRYTDACFREGSLGLVGGAAGAGTTRLLGGAAKYSLPIAGGAAAGGCVYGVANEAYKDLGW